MNVYQNTHKQLDKIRALLSEAHQIAYSMQQSGLTAIRFEASNIVFGLKEVETHLQDTTTALHHAEADDEGAA